MSTTDIREKLHRFVDTGDEKLLNIMYAVAKEYNDEDDLEYEFGNEELYILEERRMKRQKGESKTYSWEEAKGIVIGKKKMK